MSSAGRTPLPSDVLTLSAAGPTRVSSLNPQQEGALIGGINADLGRLTRRSQGMNLTLSVTAIPASNDVVLLIGIVLNPCHFGGGGSLPSLLQVCRKCAIVSGQNTNPPACHAIVHLTLPSLVCQLYYCPTLHGANGLPPWCAIAVSLACPERSGLLWRPSGPGGTRASSRRCRCGL